MVTEIISTNLNIFWVEGVRSFGVQMNREVMKHMKARVWGDGDCRTFWDCNLNYRVAQGNFPPRPSQNHT